MTEDPHTGPHQVDLAEWIDCAPFEQLLKITIVEAKDGTARLTMPFERQFAQGKGLLHGGALVSLADTAVVMAIKSLLAEDTHFVTVSMETRFLRPVRQGVITALARVDRQEGRTLWGRRWSPTKWKTKSWLSARFSRRPGTGQGLKNRRPAGPFLSKRAPEWYRKSASRVPLLFTRRKGSRAPLRNHRRRHPEQDPFRPVYAGAKNPLHPKHGRKIRLQQTHGPESL